MKKALTAFITILALAAFMAAGCGGGQEETKKAPTYPACENNTHCKSHNQYCVGGTCKDCGKASHCAACEACDSGKCVAVEGCCRSDKDCGPNENCIRKPGKKSGTCKAK